MTTDHDHDDEPLSDLPEASVPDEVSRTIKGGATDQRVVTSMPSVPPSAGAPIHIIPKTIDPCW